MTNLRLSRYGVTPDQKSRSPRFHLALEDLKLGQQEVIGRINNRSDRIQAEADLQDRRGVLLTADMTLDALPTALYEPMELDPMRDQIHRSGNIEGPPLLDDGNVRVYIWQRTANVYVVTVSLPVADGLAKAINLYSGVEASPDNQASYRVRIETASWHPAGIALVVREVVMRLRAAGVC